MTTKEKVRENRLRRVAKRLRLQIIKRGGYLVYDRTKGTTFCETLDELAKLLSLGVQTPVKLWSKKLNPKD